MADASPERIRALHEWYRANVLSIPLTPEVERRWWTFFQQGYNGQQLARVVRWLRNQISAGKRNAGSLKLSVLLDWSEDGTLMRFAEDLALAEAAAGGRLSPDRMLAPLPTGEAPAGPAPARGPAVATPPPNSDPAAAAAALAELRRFRERNK